MTEPIDVADVALGIANLTEQLHKAIERAEKAEAEVTPLREALRSASQWMTVGEWEEFAEEYPIAALALDEP